MDNCGICKIGNLIVCNTSRRGAISPSPFHQEVQRSSKCDLKYEERVCGNLKVYEATTLIEFMEDRAKVYTDLREKVEALKREFTDIVELDNDLKGKGADAIKGFYQGQIDVADAMLRFIDMQIAFLNGVSGAAADVVLSGETIVDVNFLENDLSIHASNQISLVESQKEDLQKIFDGIDDIISLETFPTDNFNSAMEDAKKKREDTTNAVDSLDQQLLEEYKVSESAEFHLQALFQQLLDSTTQGNTIYPINFNAQAYKAGEAYQLKDEVEQYAGEYLTFKEEQEKFREELKKAEELETRPLHEKAWDTIKTFAGEATGYYDFLRVKDGVDPITGEEISEGQRVAAGAMATAGLIPVVGWAGRIFKGGSAIYKTAKGMNAADKALDVYRTTSTFSNLEKAELGIYGLASANGFSEYITGKDMFGNELTDIQRQQSLYNSILGPTLMASPFIPTLIKNGKLLKDETLTHIHQLATKTKSGARYIYDEVQGGFHALLHNQNMNFEFAVHGPILSKVMNPKEIAKRIEEAASKFSFGKSLGLNKGADDVNKVPNKNTGKELHNIELGNTDLANLRKKWNVPETHTIAVGKTDVKGLEDFTFEGGSPRVRKEAGLPDLDVSNPNRPIKSSGKIPSATRHAEEGVANQFVESVEKAGIQPDDVVGTLRLHQSNPSGVCPTCLSGLGNPKKAPGVIKQLSLKYPNLVVEVTSQTVEGAKVNGRLEFKVKNGVYID